MTIVEKPADATAISIGFPIDVTRRDDDFYALAVANSYLGEHRTFNGKLMQDLRGKRGLNYGDYSYIEDFIQEGMSTVPRAEQPAAAAGLLDLDPPRPARQGGLRPPRGPLGARPAASRTGSAAADFEATRVVPAQLQQALGADPLAPARLRDGRRVLRPATTWSPSWPTGCPS